MVTFRILTTRESKITSSAYKDTCLCGMMGIFKLWLWKAARAIQQRQIQHHNTDETGRVTKLFAKLTKQGKVKSTLRLLQRSVGHPCPFMVQLVMTRLYWTSYTKTSDRPR